MDPDLTRLLDDLRHGDGGADARAWEIVYPEMVRLARAQRRRWQGDWTLDTRGLAHEAYLRLFGPGAPQYTDRLHFFRLVSRAVRQVLVNYAEARTTLKRGGAASPATLGEEVPDLGMGAGTIAEVLDLHEALNRFSKLDPRAAEVVQLRYFAGLTHGEIADTLGISVATVERDWSAARAWLTLALDDRD